MIIVRRLHAVVALLGITTVLVFNYFTQRMRFLQHLPAPTTPASLYSSHKMRVFTDEPRIVYVRDVWKFGYDRPHPELCPELGIRLRLLILVMSAPGNAASRDAIRHSWGQHRSNVSLAFVLGKTLDQFNAALNHEDSLHGDLVTGRNLDHYSNLPLKPLSILEWMDTYCPLVPFLLKTDDDVFINMPRLLQFISKSTVVNATRTIWGKKSRKEKPKRKYKYYVSELQFPELVFPDFLTGPAYILTADCVKPLLAAAAAPDLQYLRLEDVFVTGVLAQRAGLTRIHAPEFYNRKIEAHPCAIQHFIAVHKIRYYDQLDYWNKLFDNRTYCKYAWITKNTSKGNIKFSKCVS